MNKGLEGELLFAAALRHLGFRETDRVFATEAWTFHKTTAFSREDRAGIDFSLVIPPQCPSVQNVNFVIDLGFTRFITDCFSPPDARKKRSLQLDSHRNGRIAIFAIDLLYKSHGNAEAILQKSAQGDTSALYVLWQLLIKVLHNFLFHYLQSNGQLDNLRRDSRISNPPNWPEIQRHQEFLVPSGQLKQEIQAHETQHTLKETFMMIMTADDPKVFLAALLGITSHPQLPQCVRQEIVMLERDSRNSELTQAHVSEIRKTLVESLLPPKVLEAK